MDDLGIDSIETAVAFAVAMEAGILAWGDSKVSSTISVVSSTSHSEMPSMPR